MANKLVALIGAITIAAAALLPSVAAADEHYRGRGHDRGYYDNGYRGHYDDRYDGRYRGGYGRDYRRDHDDNDDAIAAGVIGLVLGAVIGSALTESSRQAPPPPRYAPPPPSYNGGYYDGRQPYYDNGPQLCVRREQTWDPYARRYVTLERRVPC